MMSYNELIFRLVTGLPLSGPGVGAGGSGPGQMGWFSMLVGPYPEPQETAEAAAERGMSSGRNLAVR